MRVKAAVAAALLVLATAATLAAVPASGATLAQRASTAGGSVLTWRGGHGTNWSTAANWMPAQVPADGDTLELFANANHTAVNDLTGLSLAGLLDVSGTISGNPITLTGNLEAEGGPTEVALDVTLAAGSHFIDGPLTVSGALSGPGSVTIDDGLAPVNCAQWQHDFPNSPSAACDYSDDQVTFTGHTPNTYTGGTTITPEVQLTLEKDAGVAAVSHGALVVQPGTAPGVLPGQLTIIGSPGQLGPDVDVSAPAGAGRTSTISIDATGSAPPTEPYETTGAVSIGAGGHLSLYRGVLQTASLTLDPGAVLEARSTPSAPASIDAGTATIEGARLVVSGLHEEAAGQVSTVLHVGGAAPVRGTFAGLPEGTAVASGGKWSTEEPPVVLQISYHGGDGNDVTLTRLASPNGMVTLAYQMLLGRNPDPQGGHYWAQFLAGGGSPSAFVDALLASSEARDHTVDLAYREMLGRSADPGGLHYWTDQLAGSLSVAELRASLLGSAEYAAQSGHGSNAGYVDSIYRIPSVLDRPADPAGLQYWTQELAAGRITRSSLALALLESPESYLANLRHLTTRVTYPLPFDPAAVYRFVGQNRLGLAAVMIADLG